MGLPDMDLLTFRGDKVQFTPCYPVVGSCSVKLKLVVHLGWVDNFKALKDKDIVLFWEVVKEQQEKTIRENSLRLVGLNRCLLSLIQ